MGTAAVAPDAAARAVELLPHGHDVAVRAFGDLRIKRNFLDVWTQLERRFERFRRWRRGDQELRGRRQLAGARRRAAGWQCNQREQCQRPKHRRVKAALPYRYRQKGSTPRGEKKSFSWRLGGW